MNRMLVLWTWSALSFATPACSQGTFIAQLERLAEAGNAEAIYHLGKIYHTGSGAAQDRAKALAAFRRAAELGDPLAAYKLGCLYDEQGGDLLAPDADKALRFKLRAAQAGYALAQQDVGALYARAGDPAAAVAWIERSAAQGWPGALMALASVHNGTPGIAPDAAKKAAYFRLFPANARHEPDQLQWLARFEQQLSPADKDRADRIVRDYRTVPTALMQKGLSGQRAAAALVARNGTKRQ